MVMGKDNFDHIINFRATDDMYKKLIEYLKQTGETISAVMRQATYDYLKFKRFIEENGLHENSVADETTGRVTTTPPEGVMYCDGDHCELPFDYKLKKDEKHDG
jgi:predicted transcriptional regulator